MTPGRHLLRPGPERAVEEPVGDVTVLESGMAAATTAVCTELAELLPATFDAVTET
jgi:hypothetical protein